MKRRRAAVRALLCLLVAVSIAEAQRASNDWMTDGSDVQRSSWLRGDGKISVARMARGEFALVWKMKMGERARLLPPSLMDFYIGYRGFRALGFFAAGTDKVVAVDTELGREEWTKQYAASGPCANSFAAVTRPTATGYAPMPLARGSGRGNPAKSGVGLPHEGSVVLAAVANRPAPKPEPKPATPRTTPPPSPFAPHVQWALSLAGDGKLHAMWISNGHEPAPAVQFIPAGAQAAGLVAYDGSAYVATTDACGTAGNGVWAMDLNTKRVSRWKSSEKIAGTAGPAVGPDGTMYVAAGKSVVALASKNLEPKAIHQSTGAAYSSSPVVFEQDGRDLLAVATADGRIRVLDAAALNGGGVVAESEPFAPAGYAPGSLASWQDAAGTRWILTTIRNAPPDEISFCAAGGEVKNGAVVAWKLVEVQGKWKLRPGWISGDLAAPLQPIIVNGVVFAASGGGRSVLYALDGLSGKPLWDSGPAMEDTAEGGLASGSSRVYVATADGTQYAFGFPIEH